MPPAVIRDATLDVRSVEQAQRGIIPHRARVRQIADALIRGAAVVVRERHRNPGTQFVEREQRIHGHEGIITVLHNSVKILGKKAARGFAKRSAIPQAAYGSLPERYGLNRSLF